MVFLVKNLPITNIEFNQSVWKDITQVLNYVFSRQELFGAYLIDFIAMATAIPTALFPAIAQNLGGVKVLGVLYSSFSIGAFIVAIFVTPWVNKIKRHGLVIVYAAAFWGIAILLFGLANNIYVAVFFLILAGCGDALSSIFRAIMYNEIVPNKLRGRLSGIEMIGYYSGPKLGDTKAGLITTAFGITTSIVSGGLLCVVCIIGCYYFLPKFVCYRSTH